MPWFLQPRGKTFCVIEKDSGKVVKCYDDKAKAREYLKALYSQVDESDTKKS